ncbi:hypothetical protein GCK72_023088 [Caenorhabditis remanei]|uniref:Protein kinase domain-containing protein n=1 Tax=Caenorhabditis remanei TaxID=31234 RepID=A0A6A5FW12_CAERE|nr:hypothetical protein GCK72_023088 [Caenorhabditis remanei]KAF1746631.1 hypothetical protein GCK72_023088 [Caenorhabditis remanei]
MSFWRPAIQSLHLGLERFRRNINRNRRIQSILIEGEECNEVELLGKGAFGTVVLVRAKNHSEKQFAVKILSTRRNQTFSATEVYFLRLLPPHENIIRMIEMIKTPDFYQVVLEYATEGTLSDKLVENVPMKAKIAQYFFKHLIEGLSCIHEHGIMHNDIKPDNLLITRQGDKEILKISDFGLSMLFRSDKSERILHYINGTDAYNAPEMYSRSFRGPPIDIWAAGIVLIVMLTTKEPWSKAVRTNRSYLYWIVGEQGIWEHIDDFSLDFIKTILQFDPAIRAAIPTIKQSPWYRHDFNTAS